MLTEAMPPGVESAAPNDPEKRLVVRGTAAGISQVRGLIRLLDVPARTVRVTLKLERSLPGQNEASRKLLCTVETSAANNASFPVTFRMADAECVAVLKPRINGDKSVTFDTKLSLRQIQARKLALIRRRRGRAACVPASGNGCYPSLLPQAHIPCLWKPLPRPRRLARKSSSAHVKDPNK